MTPLILLFSCSGLLPWSAGTRGLPDMDFVQIDGTECLRIRATTEEPVPGIDDAVRSFPRPVLRSEAPFAIAHIWLPPFSEWPTHDGNYAGFRLTISDQYPRFVWPGIFISGGATGPHFTVRVLSDDYKWSIPRESWWTLGIGIERARGVLSFYAAPGRVAALTESDRFFTDETGWTYVTSFNGFFLQVATPEPWYFGAVQLYARVAMPMLFPIQIGRLTATGGYPTEQYSLQKSTDLASWLPIATLADGETFLDNITEDRQFYRLAR